MRALVAEGLGTAFLLIAVVGSGIMGERLAGGNAALALLANAVATGTALSALIVALGPISGAHFNPAVSMVTALRGTLPRDRAAAYIAAQLLGACAGVAAAHLMFETPVMAWSHHVRAGAAQVFSEWLATLGLIVVILGCASRRQPAAAFAIGAYVTGAYWFTASTSFANPAVTVARVFTDTFAGIRWMDAPPFVAAQVLGAWTAALLMQWLLDAGPRAVEQPE